MANGDTSEGLDKNAAAFWERLHETNKVATEQGRQIGELTGNVKTLVSQQAGLNESLRSLESTQRSDTAQLMTAITTHHTQQSSALAEASKRPPLAPYIAIGLALMVAAAQILNWQSTSQQRETDFRFTAVYKQMSSTQESIMLIVTRMAEDDHAEKEIEYNRGVQDTTIAFNKNQIAHFDQIRHDEKAAALIAQNYRDLWLGALESRVASGETSMLGMSEYMREHTAKRGPGSHPTEVRDLRTKNAINVENQ